VVRGKGKGAADDAKKNQMWVEKYRPTRLADVAAHKVGLYKLCVERAECS
jgi:hypothetical protein